MRTTLDIDNDVLEVVKNIARKKNVSAGQAVSQLLRRVLTGQSENQSYSTGANNTDSLMDNPG